MVEAFFFHEERHFINARSGEVIDDSFRFHVAEHADFLFHFRGQFLHGSADNDIGLDTDRAEFFDAVLCRFRFQFACRLDVGNEGDVDIGDVISVGQVFSDLADGFEERE